jgi:hypothetical protein
MGKSGRCSAGKIKSNQIKSKLGNQKKEKKQTKADGAAALLGIDWQAR